MDCTLHPAPVTHAQFLAAAAGNDVATLRAYVEQGGNVDLVNADGESALVVATRAGHEQFLVELLDASPTLEAQWGGCALECASLAGRHDLVGRFYDAMLARMRPVSHEAMIEAIHQDDMRVVRRYLAQGGGQLGPALIAACRGHRYGMVTLLLSAGADLHFLDPNGHWTALQVAADRGDTSMVSLLLAHAATGATRPFGPNDFWKALLAAVNKHRRDVVAQLLEAGAKPYFSEIPAALRTLKSDAACTDPSAARSTLKVLLAATSAADLDEFQLFYRKTLLHQAALNDASWSIDTLIENGCAVDAAADSNGHGETPFLSAVSKCSVGCLRHLAAHGADVHRTDQTGQRALSIALSLETNSSLTPAVIEEVVVCLLELGCDPNLPDLDGQTPRLRAGDRPDLASLMDAHVARKAIRTTLSQAALHRPCAPR